MKKVFVEWYDALSETDNGWTPVEDCKGDLAICYSLGFLVKETGTSIVVAGHTDPDYDDFSGEVVIPKVCIIRIREVVVQND